ncbi:transposase IS4 family protein [Methanohalobium evestigatum Z-7303]|uniref:Transposase IS4 family protein n=1 Tax=Methanohalobium evestigatum (strain ATCC BAA-1072 / DSM 3721 / NBRC 107634 / OCM 161 / Z-7303) TaxID=644295 RepID=D7E9T9_METEZ|nr:transposase [Methanohalobium evestigatum]ADI74361.1 transposase IS4 family protein [Methanohalobium evestigatum Z-7303]
MLEDSNIYVLNTWNKRKKEKEKDQGKITTGSNKLDEESSAKSIESNEPEKQSVSGITLPKRLPDQIRKLRGLLIAKRGSIKRNHKVWTVKGDQNKEYQVKFDKMKGFSCNCPDSEHRITCCKHVYAVEAFEDGSELPPKDELSSKLRELEEQHEEASKFTQNWSAYNTYQCTEKEALYKILDEICEFLPEYQQGNGRPKTPPKDSTFCSVAKVYSMLSGRRFDTDVRYLHEKGYIQSHVHYNTILNCMKSSELESWLQYLIDITGLPFVNVENIFAVDSSGFSTSVTDTWYEHKYQVKKDERIWMKCHIMAGLDSKIITAAKVTQHRVNDNIPFSDLIYRTAERFNIEEISADKAYSSKSNIELIRKLGAEPFIPFKNNLTGKSRGVSEWAEEYRKFVNNKAEFSKHFGNRNKVESVFNMMKSKFGVQLKSRDEQALINEVLCKVLCHNICVLIHEVNENNVELQPMYQYGIMDNKEGGVCASD